MTIQLTCLDIATDGDDVAEEGRKFAIVDNTAGWGRRNGGGTAQDRNVKLFVKKPV